MKQGYIQVYTGNGKGKTTASLGLIMRAVAAGYTIYLGQFIKDKEYNEIKTLHQRFPEVTVVQYGAGRGCLLRGEADEIDKAAAADGYKQAMAAVSSGDYDVVILDEINVAASFDLVSEDQILELMAAKPAGTELILTGRYAPEKVCQAADLVTEMSECKHYYEVGVMARPGIEM